ncbi:hypothetical protein Tco_1352486 [Tanacetum coccineum]
MFSLRVERFRLWRQHKKVAPWASRRLNGIGCAIIGGNGGGGGEGLLKAKSSEVIGENVRVTSIDELSLEVIEEEEDVPLVDGFLNGTLGVFGDRDLCFSDGVLTSSWLGLERLRVEMKKGNYNFLLLDESERTHDSIDNVMLTIIEIGVPLHDLSKQASQQHTVRTRLEESVIRCGMDCRALDRPLRRPETIRCAFTISEDTFNRFKMRVFGILLEAYTKAVLTLDSHTMPHLESFKSELAEVFVFKS